MKTITYRELTSQIDNMILYNAMGKRLYNTLELNSDVSTLYNYYHAQYNELTKEKYEELEENGKEVR